MHDALTDSNTQFGTVSAFTHFQVSPDIVSVLGLLRYTDVEGSGPYGVCSNADALRQGAIAFPLVGLPNLIVPLDKPFWP